MFYMTWALKSQPETQASLTEAYHYIAEKLGAKLAPVGLVWQKAKQIARDIDLYHPDGRHANPMGAYLTALVFYAILFNTSPEGLPGKGKERVNLDKERALFLQKIAYESVSDLVFGV